MFSNSNQSTPKNAGFLLILVLVMGSVFLFIVSSFIGYVVTQNQVVNFRHEQQRATEIAEAGLNYYRWFLAHYPDDVTNGTGLPGPYVHKYRDPEGDVIGEFSLAINSNSYCGDIASIDITSTAHTYVNPNAKAVVSAQYKRPTVAEYSFITNRSVWYGDDRVITGPLHSNQGIRMDGYHNSFVGSGLSDWTCDGSFGCNPSQTVDGVYTTSGHATPGLFSYPVSPVDFAGLTLDLSSMKNRAQNNGGIYYGTTAGWGYQVIFNGDDTVTVRRVTSAPDYWAYSSEQGWHTGERNVISNSSLIATHTIDPSCPLLFFEDKVWLEGAISSKVALAAANLSSAGETNIVINDDITYNNTDSGLLAIAKDDVDVGLDVPYDLTANGIYIAQNGRFGRNHYCTSCSGWVSWSWRNFGLPWYLDPYVNRGTLTRFGSVVSNGRVGTQWVNSSGNTISGFQNRNTSFDRNQVANPPPLTPNTSDVYELSEWRQEG